jgi:5-methyltetrahydropteroyltriglutamate--homocysteine methyltransferase
MKNVTSKQLSRKAPYSECQPVQASKLCLSSFPITTIGSFPQTNEIRVAHNKYIKGELTREEYEVFIKQENERVVLFHEKIGLDVLVLSEPERNDMVQYFGEQLEGIVFTQGG